MPSENYGLIGWFTKNPVAANLLMILVISAGLISALNISKNMFPVGELDQISVSAMYPGAAPVELEKGVILPMEAALQGLKGIKKSTLVRAEMWPLSILKSRAMKIFKRSCLRLKIASMALLISLMILRDQR